MPCDQINIFQADLDHLTNWDRLEEVAKTLGYRVYREGNRMVLDNYQQRLEISKGGQTRVTGARLSEQRVAEIKASLTQAYTKASVVAAAKRWGWQAEEKEPMKLTIRKRS